MHPKNTLIINDEIREYVVERKKTKALKIKVLPDLSIRVISPYNISYKEINKFLNEKIDWITKNIEHFKLINIKPKPEYKSGSVINFFDRKFNLEVIKSPEQVIQVRGDRMIIRILHTNEEIIEDIIYGWYRIHSPYYFNLIIEKCLFKLEKYGIKKPRLSVRKMKSSWGSCSKVKNKIILNSMLAGKSMEFIVFIVMHELCHLVHANHSKDFYALLSELMPDWKLRKNKVESMWN